MTKYADASFSVFVTADQTKRPVALCRCEWVDPRGKCVMCGQRVTDKPPAPSDKNVVWVSRR